MKRFLSILSAFIFLLGAAGYYFVFTAADMNVKNEMSAMIESKIHFANQVHFTFTSEQMQRDIHFTKANHKEFIYGGEHFDVLKIERNGAETSFTCIADKKETALFTSFSRQLDEQSSSQNTSGKISVKPAMQDWFFETQAASIPSVIFSLMKTEDQIFHSEIQFEILSPPPKA